MKGEYRHHDRVIVRTRICSLSRRPHWHASVVTAESLGSTTSEGTGLCLGTVAAWFWLVTGKTWFAAPEAA